MAESSKSALEPKKDDAVKLNPTIDFIAGTIAGSVALVVGHPIDTVKTRLQTPSLATRYGKSAWKAFVMTRQEEGIRGLYKGIASPLAGTAFMNGMIFGAYGFLLRLQQKNKDEEPTLTQVGIAGAGAGVFAGLVTTPIDLVKIRQQNDLGTSGLPSTRQVALDIFRRQGVFGLYRGITITAIRDTSYGVYFATYEALCRWLAPPNSDGSKEQLSWGRLMFAGGCGGLTGWLSTYPLDTVKCRMQATEYQSPSSKGTLPPNPYNNTWSAIVNSYKQLGFKGYWAGVTPTIIRGFPVNMVTFLVYELVVMAAGGR